MTTTSGQDDAWIDDAFNRTFAESIYATQGDPDTTWAEFKQLIRAHLDEAVRMARNQAIDDCIAVVRSKQIEDAEAIAERMAALKPKSEGERG